MQGIFDAVGRHRMDECVPRVAFMEAENHAKHGGITHPAPDRDEELNAGNTCRKPRVSNAWSF